MEELAKYTTLLFANILILSFGLTMLAAFLLGVIADFRNNKL